MDEKLYGADFRNVSLKERFALRRKISRFAVMTRHYPVSREIEKEIMRDFLKSPGTDMHYMVTYQADAPQSAAAWVMTPAYSDWNSMETRMYPVNQYFQSAARDEALLKDVPVQKANDAYKTGLSIVYDLEGVHIYIRAEDPDVADARLGKKKSREFEMFIRPGPDSVYNWFYLSDVPECPNTGGTVEWSSPGRDHKMTYDYLRKDGCFTETGYAFHVLIPWEMYAGKLPSPDRQWTLGCMGNGMTLNGNVHELSRALKIDFQFSPETLIAIQKNTALKAYYAYKKYSTSPYEMIQIWESDTDIGDPDFYQEKLESLIQELDEAGERLEKTEESAEIDEIYRKYVPLWQNIRYEAADRRVHYLRDRFLGR